jgi:L-rhamnose-H+ transport protein
MDTHMSSMVLTGALLAILSGVMNGTFTLPMRFLGKWEWENVWSLFIAFACLVMPTAILALIAPQSWGVIATAPTRSICIAVATGFAWGFGAIFFGQSVSAIGISLANTLVLAISSALGSLLPMLLITPENLFRPAGQRILGAVAVEIAGIALCGWAGGLREKSAGIAAERGEMVGRARPVGVALLMAVASGVLSAVFNTGFALAQPIAACGRAAGMSEFSSTNLIWWLMLTSGSLANLGFCIFLFRKNHSLKKFTQPGAFRLYILTAVMALLWGGSIFVYGASAPRLGSLGSSIGWPLSLAVGLLLANAIGIRLGEWKQAPRRARAWMYSGVAVLVVAVILLSRVNH